MLSKQINPFAAILAIIAVAGVGTFFVLQKISTTDFTYTYEDASLSASPGKL